MKKGILVAGGLIIVLGIAGTAGWYYYKENIQNATSDGDAVYVTKVSTLTGESSGVTNRFAGVVEAQETVEIKIESGRKVTEVQVKEGDVVKKGQLLFEYDLSSIEEDLQEARLDLDRLKNEALSLADQISTLEKEKKNASSDNQLSYTIEIETNKMNLKKNEYNQTSKEAEIQKLENATLNTEVRSEIEGVIQKIDTSKLDNEDGDSLDDGSSYYSYSSSSSSSDAFITILSTGAYRIKGTINELNANTNAPVEGESMIIRSRADETQIWYGTMGSIDRENPTSNQSDSYYYGMVDTSESTTSSSYPFYVDLESSDGLMLGQHVYIERDEGQESQKDGLWLSEYYIVDADKENPYVWAANEKNRLEKRYVILGNYDEDLCEYEIVDGLTKTDLIAFPEEDLTEGRMTTQDSSVLLDSTYDTFDDYEYDDYEYDDYEYDDYEYDDYEYDDYEGDYEEMPEIIEESYDEGYDESYEESYDESYDEMTDDFDDEELVPLEGAPVFGSDDVEAAG